MKNHDILKKESINCYKKKTKSKQQNPSHIFGLSNPMFSKYFNFLEY